MWVLTKKATVSVLAICVVTVGLLVNPAGGQDNERSDAWIDQLTGFVVVQRGIAQAKGEGQGFDPYFGQLALVRSLYTRSDRSGSYTAMNHLMDMLEARQEAISARAADAIWDYCYQVTPPALHDVKRHKEWWDKQVDWEKFFWEE